MWKPIKVTLGILGGLIIGAAVVGCIVGCSASVNNGTTTTTISSTPDKSSASTNTPTQQQSVSYANYGSVQGLGTTFQNGSDGWYWVPSNTVITDTLNKTGEPVKIYWTVDYTTNLYSSIPSNTQPELVEHGALRLQFEGVYKYAYVWPTLIEGSLYVTNPNNYYVFGE